MDTTEAKAVLAHAALTQPKNEAIRQLRQALSFVIAENERLTAQLAADEIDGVPVRQELARLRTPSLLIGDSEKAAIAAYIETLAAQLARCGKEKCFGRDEPGVKRWVRASRLEDAEARALAAEAKLAEMRQVTDEDAHWLAELVWSELYGVRRWRTDDCAKDLNDIMHEILTGYIERKEAAFLAARVRT